MNQRHSVDHTLNGLIKSNPCAHFRDGETEVQRKGGPCSRICRRQQQSWHFSPVFLPLTFYFEDLAPAQWSKQWVDLGECVDELILAAKATGLASPELSQWLNTSQELRSSGHSLALELA